MPGTFPRHRLQSRPPVSDPGMHHGTCVTHVPWCMSGSLTRGGGKHNTGIPSASASGYFTYLARGQSATLFKELYLCWWCSSALDLYIWSMFTPKLFQIFFCQGLFINSQYNYTNWLDPVNTNDAWQLVLCNHIIGKSIWSPLEVKLFRLAKYPWHEI